jgi:hypothetical protein
VGSVDMRELLEGMVTVKHGKNDVGIKELD